MAKKILIDYLDLGDGRYIENDKIKYSVTENSNTQYMSWEELWTGVKNDIDMIKKYVQRQDNQD